MQRLVVSLLLCSLAACGGAGPRFTPDVAEAIGREEMVRAETDLLILYYPAKRQAMVERFAVRAEACAAALKSRARHHGRAWREKMTIIMPEVTFNNAYVAPKLGGSPDHSVIPTLTNLDFTTEMGLPPDAGFVACHELVHYVQDQQIAGLWNALNLVFGDLWTPQTGFDPWVFEGIATHYEAALQPGVGRPVWPVFRGMFAAAYAGKTIRGGDLSALGRKSPVGHHYLVGTFFINFLVERYGEEPLWKTIEEQGSAWTGMLAPRAFKKGYGKSLSTLIDEFDAWHKERFPTRARPAAQRRLATVGNIARYARSRQGSEAWIAEDPDQPTTLVVRDASGATRARVRLTDIFPPRTLVISTPQLVSGLSMTADGNEVWFTAIDLGENQQVPRLLRWRRDEGLREIASGLGSGGTIDATGRAYYYLAADGDRWSLAVYDVASGKSRVLLDAAPGTYVLSAQLSPDGKTLATSAWNGAAFVVWLLDAQTGAFQRELSGDGPVYDPGFLDDGRLVHLAAIDGRFQVVVRSPDGQLAQPITDVPYTALAPRPSANTVRFLNRDGWSWTLDEVSVPPAAPPPPEPAAPPPPEPTAPPPASAAVAAPGADLAFAAAQPGATPAPLPAAPAPTTGTAPAPTTGTAPAPTTAPATAPGDPGAQPLATAPPKDPIQLSNRAAYSAWDDFFVPRLRVPFGGQPATGASYLGITLGGSDVLGQHGWLLSAAVQPTPEGDTGGPYYGGLLQYHNDMLAPWSLLAVGSSFRGVEIIETEGQPDQFRTHETSDLALVAARTWNGSWSLAGLMLYTDKQDGEVGAMPAERVRLGGPALSLGYFGGYGTDYGGFTRGVVAQLSAAFYPKVWSSLDRDASTLRADLIGVTTLPLTARHVLRLDTTGLAVVRAADIAQLGGASLYAPLSFESNRPEPDEPDFGTPASMREVVLLRGYEDLAFAVSRVAAAQLSWTYPLIIDRGFASTLWIFPSTFLSQIDLNLFAAGALSTNESAVGTQSAQHLAAGGAVTLHLALWRMGFSFRYQIARRLRDDEATTQLFGLAGNL